MARINSLLMSRCQSGLTVVEPQAGDRTPDPARLRGMTRSLTSGVYAPLSRPLDPVALPVHQERDRRQVALPGVGVSLTRYEATFTR